MKAIVLTLVIFALTAVSGVAVLQYYYAPKDGIPFEIAKALLNVLTVAVSVQIVTLVVARYNETRQRGLEADRLRYHTIDALNEAYVGVKRIRRCTRAQSGVRQATGTEELRFVTKRLYFKSLEDLNDLQLKLEVLAKDVESNAELFREGRTIFSRVSSMEEYLNQIVHEWEHLQNEFVGSPAAASVHEMPRFQDLIGHYRASRFRPEFVHAYYKALELTRDSLVFTKSATWKVRVHATRADRNEVGRS